MGAGTFEMLYITTYQITEQTSNIFSRSVGTIVPDADSSAFRNLVILTLLLDFASHDTGRFSVCSEFQSNTQYLKSSQLHSDSSLVDLHLFAIVLEQIAYPCPLHE